MRKFRAFVLTVIFSSLLCEACGNNNPEDKIHDMEPDSIVCSMLGSTVSNILFNPTSVTCYTLKGKEKVDSSDQQIEAHWVRDSLIGKLEPQLYGFLQFTLLSDADNYKMDSLRAKAPYIPTLEFEFKRKKETVHVLISTSDFSWTVVYNEIRVLHFNYQHKKLVGRFSELIINNKKTSVKK